MIIPFINQKLLLSDTSQVEAQRVADVLKSNQIKFYQKTMTQGGNTLITRNMDLRTAQSMKYGMAVDSVNTYIYLIYVKKRDLERAKELIAK